MNRANIEKFSCKICLEIAQEPVITPCGHLYCWTCIYQWKNTKPEGNFVCPFCSNFLDITKLTPIYTNEENQKDPTKEIPKRPQPERNSAPPQNDNTNRNGNFSFNVFGLPFLFGGFGFSFGNNGQNVGRNPNVRAGNVLGSNVYLILVIIALNLLLDFGPLILGAGDNDFEHERRDYSKFKKATRPSSSGVGTYKTNLVENDFILFFATMVFFLGIAFLWRFLKKRN